MHTAAIWATGSAAGQSRYRNKMRRIVNINIDHSDSENTAEVLKQYIYSTESAERTLFPVSLII